MNPTITHPTIAPNILTQLEKLRVLLRHPDYRYADKSHRNVFKTDTVLEEFAFLFPLLSSQPNITGKKESLRSGCQYDNDMNIDIGNHRLITLFETIEQPALIGEQYVIYGDSCIPSRPRLWGDASSDDDELTTICSNVYVWDNPAIEPGKKVCMLKYRYDSAYYTHTKYKVAVATQDKFWKECAQMKYCWKDTPAPQTHLYS